MDSGHTGRFPSRKEREVVKTGSGRVKRSSPERECLWKREGSRSLYTRRTEGEVELGRDVRSGRRWVSGRCLLRDRGRSDEGQK